MRTFRGKSGLWTEYDPSEVASIESFTREPSKFWKFAREIGSAFLTAEPNEAHRALAELEQMRYVDCVITQNIDGLHQRAGSRHVIELYGNVDRVNCTMCGASYATREILDSLTQQDVPRCEKCSGTLKPSAILFGEEIPKKTLNQALQKIRSTDLLLAIGTSLEVQPAGSFPDAAKKNGAKVVLINNGRTEWDGRSDYEVHGPAEEILPRIVQAMKITF